MGIFFDLGQAISGVMGFVLGFDYGEAVVEDVIGAFLELAAGFGAGGHDAAVGEGHLFADLVILPAGLVEFGGDIDAAGVGLGEGGHDLVI